MTEFAPGSQRTLAEAIRFSGTGIHTGASSHVTVWPCEPGAGRVFLVNGSRIPADARFVVGTARCTMLGDGGDNVSTVEHLLSALHAYQIDNAIIEVSGPEIPILDGSAAPFAAAIEAAGVQEQDERAVTVVITDIMEIRQGNAVMRAEPHDVFAASATTEFDFWDAGRHTASYSGGSCSEYVSDIAPARTFAFRFEVERLIAAGLARGGSLDNALIIDPPDGYSSPLRVPAEWCAHKLLDLVGDLALVNRRICASVHGLRPGHSANAAMAAAILRCGHVEK